MPETLSSTERLEAFLREHGGFVRLEDLRQQGIDRRNLYALAEEGLVERVGQGLYRSTDVELCPPDDLAEAAIAVPHGVVCLTSALVYHDLTDENPSVLHMAVEGKRWGPRVISPPVKFHYFSGKAFSAGIEEVQLDGVPVRVYSVEKTLADCLKYRHKLPPGVPQAALRDYVRRRKLYADQLLHYARICRVEPLLRLYMEVLL
ncbi:MAG TPA: type IV toxin-antitoxin system AbiEi family antitoxin domain-containing protein [Ktedonobacterales bacterium]|jgi:predicted transcriptional regulator of viral defense system